MEEFRGQDEPFWTVLAVGSAGALETVAGRYDDALGHLRKARDLGERFDNAWLAVFSRAQLGILAVVRGRLADARAQLDEALELSMAARSTRSVTLCLAAFAQLAFAAGDPGRAALLAGAAEGLRRRVGLRTWPMLGRGRLSWWPSSARRWGPTTTKRWWPPAPDSTSGRRWPPSATSAALAHGRPEPWPSPGPARQLPTQVLLAIPH